MRWQTLLLIAFLASAPWGCAGPDRAPNAEADAPPPQARAERSCASLPTTFPSYDAAIAEVSAADFEVAEHHPTEESSWVRGVDYYSCDGATGYLILHTDKQAYIHQGVPRSVWEDFQLAESAGGFYNRNIKGRYQM